MKAWWHGAVASGLLLAGAAGAAGAQTPAPAVHVGFGVDTTIADVGRIVRLVREYLARPDSSALSRGLWNPADELWHRVGDVASGQAYQGFPATIVGVIPTDADDSTYVVRILHATAGGTPPGAMPLALQRLYAVRENGAPFGFRLANALPYLTRDWPRQAEGALTFWYAPGQIPDPSKVELAVQFVDSVARLFVVPPPARLDVYVARTMEEAQRAIGLDFFVEASGPGEGRGGRALGGDIVLVGDGDVGEAYLHEFVHVVLNPSLRGRTGLWSEGVATWLGGSRGRTPAEMYTLLRRFQESHPTLTLRALLRRHSEAGGRADTDAVYATGALVVDAVHRTQGIEGVRAMASLADSEAILAELAAAVQLPDAGDESIDRWWRGAVGGHAR